MPDRGQRTLKSEKKVVVVWRDVRRSDRPARGRGRTHARAASGTRARLTSVPRQMTRARSCAAPPARGLPTLMRLGVCTLPAGVQWRGLLGCGIAQSRCVCTRAKAVVALDVTEGACCLCDVVGSVGVEVGKGGRQGALSLADRALAGPEVRPRVQRGMWKREGALRW